MRLKSVFFSFIQIFINFVAANFVELFETCSKLVIQGPFVNTFPQHNISMTLLLLGGVISNFTVLYFIIGIVRVIVPFI